MSFDRSTINKMMFAEPGDKVEICLYNSDNSRHRFVVPSNEICQNIGLSLYYKVIGKCAGEIFDHEGKKYLLRFVQKPDIDSQFHSILDEMIDYFNDFYHFNFYESFFRVYYGNYILQNKLCSDQAFTEQLSDLVKYENAYILASILGEDTQSIDIMSPIVDGNDNLSIPFSYQKNKSTNLVADFYKDLATFLLAISNEDHTNTVLSDIDEFRIYCSYAKELYYLARNVKYPFGDNIWSTENIYIDELIFENKYHHTIDISISTTKDYISEFQYSNTLTSSVIIPENIQSIGAYAFCDSLLANIDFKSGNLISIANNAFENTRIRTLIIPEGTRIIGESAFCGCSELKTVVIPESVERIECDAFASCKSLNKVIILSENINLDPKAFCCCDNLSEITYYSRKHTEIVTSDSECESNSIEDKISKPSQKLYDIIECPYQLKKDVKSCPYCKNELKKKDCVYNDGKKLYLVTLLYCDICTTYYINNIVKNDILHSGKARPTAITPKSWNQIDAKKLVPVPIIPKGILVTNGSTKDTLSSGQLISPVDMVIIEENPIYNGLISHISINEKAEVLPYSIAAKDLLSINAELTECYNIQFNFLSSSLNVYYHNREIDKNNLVKAGEEIRIEEARDFKDGLGRTLSKVMVNNSPVSLPYSCLVNGEITISAEYTSSFYIFMDKRLKIISADKKYNLMNNSSSSFERYVFSESANIVIEAKEEYCNIRKIKFRDKAYNLPARIHADHQGVVTITDFFDSYSSFKFKCSSDKLVVCRNETIMKNGDILHKGDTLKVRFLEKSAALDNKVLHNGKIITPPCTIAVWDNDAVFEVISQHSTGTNIDIEHSGSSTSNDMQLNSSSFLGDLGYSTQLGTAQRYEILQKAVRIYGKTKVINFIEFLIRGKLGQINGARKYQNAISTWRYDIERIKNM